MAPDNDVAAEDVADVGSPAGRSAFASLRETLRMAAGLFRRPQPLTIPMVVLFAIIPFYLVIGAAQKSDP